ncbi:hypothetical protein V5799_021199 [Amblyomma americanum]|uniref:Uncharacterized protein n=1 Tax=Amblyomma americanum TaxID=6943 RepID=A0AAQ4FQZ5_AMBAM
MLVAATLLPRFKLSWSDDEAKPNAVVETVKSELPRFSRLAGILTATCLSSSTTEDDFFGNSFTSSSSEDEELLRYILVPRTFVLSGLKENFPRVHQLFLKVNTGIPSSASVVRLFSVGADVFTKKRGKLSDDSFEMQLLLKFNSKL